MPTGSTDSARRKPWNWRRLFTKATSSSAIRALTAGIFRRMSRHAARHRAGAIEAALSRALAPGTGERPLGRRFVDDSKVTDHHAIIPTTITPGASAARRAQDLRPDLPPPAERLARGSHLGGHHRDHRHRQPRRDRPLSHHRHRRAAARAGRSSTSFRSKPRGNRAISEPTCPAARPRQGQLQTVLDAEALKKKTRPPKRFTEATLLTGHGNRGQNAG